MATDTGSTNNKDSYLIKDLPDVNVGGADYIAIKKNELGAQRGLIHFSLSSGSGTITRIRLYLYCYLEGNVGDIRAHKLTRTNWTELGCTWNNYDGSNAWIGGGGAEGDYDITAIHTTEVLTTGWKTWDLIEPDANGTGLTLTWEDELHLLLKATAEVGIGNLYARFDAKEKSANDPYILITYTPPVVVPTVTTQAATDITTTTATGNGNITATGGENCDIRGIVWDLASQGAPGDVAPGASGYANDVAENNGFGTGAFTRSLTGLPTGDTIYCRAYAHNTAGYAYGAEVNFNTESAGYGHNVNGIAAASIGGIDGVPTANIAKVNGV